MARRSPRNHSVQKPRAPTNSKIYVHDKLPKDAIRLLEVSREFNSRGIPHGLTTVVKRPEYTALSYHWGSPKAGDEITFSEGQTLPLSRNLYLALESLKREPESRFSFLWIDQVCINQSKLSEMSQQVGIMGGIYSGASEVIVWLGAESEIANIPQLCWAVECLQQYKDGKKPTVAEIYMLLVEEAEKKSKEPSHEEYLCPDSFATNGFIGLLSLWSRPWFKRLWVRQEVVLNEKKNVMFRCGNNNIPLRKLAKACRIQLAAAYEFRSAGAHVKISNLDRETDASFSDISRAKELFDMVDFGTQSLLDVIRFTFDLETSKKRDRLYATYHLSSAATNKDFQPNYRKPMKLLWRKLAEYLFSQDRFDWKKSPKNRSESADDGRIDRDQVDDDLMDDAQCDQSEHHSDGYPSDDSRSGLHRIHGVQKREIRKRKIRKCASQRVVYLEPKSEETESTSKPSSACPSVVLALPSTQNNADKRPEFPSWVPQFDQLGHHSAHKFDHYVHYSGKFAAGGKEEEFKPILVRPEGEAAAELQLRLKGVIMSTVVRLAGKATQQPSLGGSVPMEFESRQYWVFVREELARWYMECWQFADWQHLHEFGKLLRQGIDDRQDDRSDITVPSEKAFQCQFPDRGSAETMRMRTHLLPFISKDAWNIDTRDHRRVLAQLKDGGYGWVPNSTSVGDKVILIEGTPFPFIVREVPKTDAHSIVGDAYIDKATEDGYWKENKGHMCTFKIQ